MNSRGSLLLSLFIFAIILNSITSEIISTQPPASDSLRKILQRKIPSPDLSVAAQEIAYEIAKSFGLPNPEFVALYISGLIGRNLNEFTFGSFVVVLLKVIDKFLEQLNFENHDVVLDEFINSILNSINSVDADAKPESFVHAVINTVLKLCNKYNLLTINNILYFASFFQDELLSLIEDKESYEINWD